MKLPGADQVRIDEQKVRGYLLSRTHPVGRFKARVFAAVGLDESSIQVFVSELHRIAAGGEVAEVEDTRFGRKYTVAGDLKGPTGSVLVLTVWIQEAGQTEVRLVTVRPRWP